MLALACAINLSAHISGQVGLIRMERDPYSEGDVAGWFAC
jgi:hypothetical protein